MKCLFILFLITFMTVFAQAQQKAREVVQMPYFNGVSHLIEGSVEKRNESNRRIIEFVGASLVYPFLRGDLVGLK